MMMWWEWPTPCHIAEAWPCGPAGPAGPAATVRCDSSTFPVTSAWPIQKAHRGRRPAASDAERRLDHRGSFTTSGVRRRWLTTDPATGLAWREETIDRIRSIDPGPLQQLVCVRFVRVEDPLKTGVGVVSLAWIAAHVRGVID